MTEILRILMRCPVTNQMLDTGIMVSGREVLNSEIYRDGKIHCRHCGQTHSMESAFPEVIEEQWFDEVWRPNP